MHSAEASASEFDLGQEMDSLPTGEKEDLIVELIKYYAECGAPSHRCEEKASRLFAALGINHATCAALPTGQTWCFGSTRTRLIVLDEPSLSLEGIEDVEAAVKATRKDPEGFERYARDALSRKGAEFHFVLSWLAKFVSPPLAVAVFFNGTFPAMAVATVSGFVMLLASLLNKVLGPTYDKVFPTIAGFLVAIVSRTASSSHFGSFLNIDCMRAVQLGTIVDLLPGVSITLSVLELAARRSVSGTVRLFAALITAFLLGFGLAYGNLLASVWAPALPPEPKCPDPISKFYTFLFLPLLLVGYAVQLNAPLRRWPVMFVAGIVSWLVLFAFDFIPLADGAEGLETAAAAFAVGLVGGFWEKLMRNRASSMLPILEGILILVPGSIAVLSLANAIVGNVSSGLSFGLRFLSVAVSITVGLFAAALVFVIPIRRRRPIAHEPPDLLDSSHAAKFLL